MHVIDDFNYYTVVDNAADYENSTTAEESGRVLWLDDYGWM